MSKFTGSLRVEFVSAKDRNAVLLEPLVWEAEEKGSGKEVEVPSGYKSDGISSPRLLWWLIPPHGHPASRAAWVHDYLLDLFREGRPHRYAPNRKAVDAQFYLALQACGISRWLAWCMWAGVRTNAWKKGEK